MPNISESEREREKEIERDCLVANARRLRAPHSCQRFLLSLHTRALKSRMSHRVYEEGVMTLGARPRNGWWGYTISALPPFYGNSVSPLLRIDPLPKSDIWVSWQPNVPRATSRDIKENAKCIAKRGHASKDAHNHATRPA